MKDYQPIRDEFRDCGAIYLKSATINRIITHCHIGLNTTAHEYTAEQHDDRGRRHMNHGNPEQRMHVVRHMAGCHRT